MLSACALTDGAKRKALTLMPDTDVERIRKKLAETDEAKRLAGIKGAPSFWGVTDVGDSLERAEKGAQLTTGELLAVARLLTDGEKYQAIEEKTGASTATISRVNKCLNYGSGGYRSVLERAEK